MNTFASHVSKVVSQLIGQVLNFVQIQEPEEHKNSFKITESDQEEDKTEHSSSSEAS